MSLMEFGEQTMIFKALANIKMEIREAFFYFDQTLALDILFSKNPVSMKKFNASVDYSAFHGQTSRLVTLV